MEVKQTRAGIFTLVKPIKMLVNENIVAVSKLFLLDRNEKNSPSILPLPSSADFMLSRLLCYVKSDQIPNNFIAL